jgi:hypothetical protein
MGKISYEAWRGHVCRILVDQGHVKRESKISPDIYRPYYEDGLSPAKAIREDLGMNAIRNYGGVYPDQEDRTNGN